MVMKMCIRDRTDPIADYLTRLRNAIQAKHRVVEVPASNLKKEITDVYKRQSYKRLIDIYSSTAKTVDALMKLELPSGVEVEIKV